MFLMVAIIVASAVKLVVTLATLKRIAVASRSMSGNNFAISSFR